ncbi:MAG: hypothetical protein EOM02_00340 [Synergistales bacterium]|nr:hypothetical protein [Synergistales bacterium]
MNIKAFYNPDPSRVLYGGYKFENARRGLTPQLEGIYVVPEGKLAEVASIYVCNHGQAPCDFSVTWNDYTDSHVTYLAWNFHLLTNMSISLLDAPLFLKGGDSIRARCSAIDSADIMVSLAEGY